MFSLFYDSENYLLAIIFEPSANSMLIGPIIVWILLLGFSTVERNSAGIFSKAVVSLKVAFAFTGIASAKSNGKFAT